jgi:hypothetical protein
MLMSTKPHYFRIGIFVILAVLLIVVAVVVFGAGMLLHDKLRFETYFDESITGLSLGSPLEFRGVRLGQVEKIGFVGNVYDLDRDAGKVSSYEPYVRVVFSVPRGSLPEFAEDQTEEVLAQMIESGLRLRVMSNILTGQAYLEADYVDPNRFPTIDVQWHPIYPYIPSAPGELTTLKDSVDKIMYRLQEIDFEGLVATFNQVLTTVDQGVTDANLPELSREARVLLAEARAKIAAIKTEEISQATETLLASLNATLTDANVPQLSREARKLIAEARAKMAAVDAEKINADLERLLVSLDQAVADANVPAISQEARVFLAEIRETNGHLKKLLAAPEALSAPTNLPQVIARLNRSLSRIDGLIATERPEIEIILANFREISDDLKELTSALKTRPANLLFSRPPRRSEVLE